LATVGTLTVDLIAQTASFNANITKAAANLNTSAARMNRSLTALQGGLKRTGEFAKALAGAFAIREIAGAVEGSLKYAAGLKVTAQQIGLTTEQLQVYRLAALQAGVNQDEMELGIRRLTASLGRASVGSEKQKTALAALIGGFRDASGHIRTTDQAFAGLADRMAKTASPAQRAAAEVTLLGRSGQMLDPMLRQGSHALDALKKSAEDAGLVLSDNLAESAHKAEVQMHMLVLQMKTSFAKEVTENANSILGLASALTQLTVRGIDLVSKYPRISLAIAGLAAGRKLGPAGMIIGAAGGFALGNQLAKAQDDANPDTGFRRQQLANAQRQMHSYARSRAGSMDPVSHQTLTNLANEVQRQAGLLQGAATNKLSLLAPTLPAGGELPNFLAGGGGGRHGGAGPHGPSAQDLSDQAARREKDFQDQLARLNDDLLNARADNLNSADDIAANARQQAQVEHDKLKADIDAKVSLRDYTDARGKQLEAINDQVLAEHNLTINAQLATKKAEEAFSLQTAANDNQRDLLQAQDALATTAGERRKSALALLDLDRKEEDAKLRQIVALGALAGATEQQVQDAKAAQLRLGALPGIYGARAAGVDRQTQGPMAAYLDGIPHTADQMSEALQSIKVNGIQSVIDGLVQIGTTFQNIGQTAKQVLASIAADLLKLQLEKLVFGLLSHGGGPANLLAGIPGYATGTDSAPGGLAWVGESGRELVNLPRGAQVIPNHRLATLPHASLAARNDNAPNVTSTSTAHSPRPRRGRPGGRRLPRSTPRWRSRAATGIAG
jgi:hypothetical protein